MSKQNNKQNIKEQKITSTVPKSMLASPKVQAYSMAIFSLFALAFFSIFALKPTLNSFFQLRKEIEDAKVLDSELTGKIRSLLRAQEEYYKHQEDLSLLDDALPQEPEFPALLSKIEDITNEERTPIVSFTTQDFSLLDTQGPKAKTESDLTDMLFTLELLAYYTNNEAVLRRLTDVRRIILFDRLAFTINPASTSDNIELEITARAFHLGANK